MYEGEGIEDDVWERSFASNDMGYYKNRRMKEMDDYFGDMYGMICGEPLHIWEWAEFLIRDFRQGDRDYS
jgi:DNA mismatch repair protein MSH5